MGALAAAGSRKWTSRGDPGYTPCNGHCASNGVFLNWRARRLGPFSTAGARRRRAFAHYRSSHNRAKWLVTRKTGHLSQY